jgi:hypothetical protein
MHFICVLSTVNMVIFKYVMVDIDLSVCGNSSAKTMAGKRKQWQYCRNNLLYLCSRMTLWAHGIVIVYNQSLWKSCLERHYSLLSLFPSTFVVVHFHNFHADWIAKNDEIHFLNFDINKAMHFICVLSTVNMVIFKYVMVDIDLSVSGNSSAKTASYSNDTSCIIWKGNS